jgi:hypothetical protein
MKRMLMIGVIVGIFISIWFLGCGRSSAPSLSLAYAFD